MDEGRGAIGGSRLVAAIEEAERTERTRLADALHDDALQRVLAARQELHELRPLALQVALGLLETDGRLIELASALVVEGVRRLGSRSAFADGRGLRPALHEADRTGGGCGS